MNNKIKIVILIVSIFYFGCASIIPTQKYVDVIYIHTYESGCDRNILRLCGELVDNKFNVGLKGYVVNLKKGSCKDNNIKPIYLQDWLNHYTVHFNMEDNSTNTHGVYIFNGYSMGEIFVHSQRMSNRNFNSFLNTYNITDKPIIYGK